jgi:hypothetical protein
MKRLPTAPVIFELVIISITKSMSHDFGVHVVIAHPRDKLRAQINAEHSGWMRTQR